MCDFTGQKYPCFLLTYLLLTYLLIISYLQYQITCQRVIDADRIADIYRRRSKLTSRNSKYHENDDGVSREHPLGSLFLWKIRLYDSSDWVRLCLRTLCGVFRPRPLLQKTKLSSSLTHHHSSSFIIHHHHHQHHHHHHHHHHQLHKHRTTSCVRCDFFLPSVQLTFGVPCQTQSISTHSLFLNILFNV